MFLELAYTKNMDRRAHNMRLNEGRRKIMEMCEK